MSNKTSLIELAKIIKSTVQYDYKTFRFIQSSKHVNKNNKEVLSLLENGFVVIENYLSAEECDKFRMQIENLLAENPEKNGKFNTDTIDTKLSSGTIIQVRQSNDGRNAYDTGMIDIKNIDYSFPDLNKIRHDETILKIVRTASGQASIKSGNFNSYVNKGIANTRCYHIDSLAIPQFKAFVYLTDVVNETYGPYSFVSKTHRFSFTKYINIVNNYVKGQPITDMRIHSKRKAIKFVASKGTLIIANQNGFHRGIPQEKNKERMILVNNFYYDPSMLTMM